MAKVLYGNTSTTTAWFNNVRKGDLVMLHTEVKTAICIVTWDGHLLDLETGDIYPGKNISKNFFDNFQNLITGTFFVTDIKSGEKVTLEQE